MILLVSMTKRENVDYLTDESGHLLTTDIGDPIMT
jgi:hypothetical protein